MNQPSAAAVVSEFTDFGFMEAELSAGTDVVLVIRRDGGNLYKPKHHLLTSDRTTVEKDSTKLYIYNAIWNKDQAGSPGVLKMTTMLANYIHQQQQQQQQQILLLLQQFYEDCDSQLAPE